MILPTPLADPRRVAFNAAMKTPPTDTSVKPKTPRRGGWLIVLAAFAVLAWTLPRPRFHDVVIESATDETTTNSQHARLAFRNAELLSEFSGKGSLADETELSGPCFGLDDRTLFFARSRPGQRADIVRSTFDGERWSKPDAVRELNSVDDDRRMTLSGDGVRAIFASNRSGGHGGFDLYEAANDGETWFRPRNIGTAINSDAEEFDPAMTPDGLTLYFVRGVPGSKADIFVARRESVEAKWSSPQPVHAINSPDTHERSPAASPDGQSLIFASNRGRRAGETGPFALFRVSLKEGVVGPVERLTDGIASDADDLDAAFSPGGLSIVFASKRDGAKQLFLSSGEFVVSQLTVSTAHLDRFGPAKWGVPFVGLLLFVVTWRWSRKARPVRVATPAVAKVVAPKRSEPPKNPLKSWTNTEPVAPQPTPVKANPLLASAALPAAITEPPAEKVLRKSTSRDAARPTRRRVAVVLLVVAASLAIAVRFDFWKRPEDSSDSSIVADARWLEGVRFADVAATQRAELPLLERFDTARPDAPQPSPIPSVAVALRPAARWPNDRVLVRSRSEVARVADIEPPASKQTQFAVIARRSLPTELTRPTARSPEETSLASIAIINEPPHVIAPTITIKQLFEPLAAERTSVPPAAANRVSLPKPTSRVDPSVPPPPNISNGNDSTRSLVRRGASTRVAEPSRLAEPQAFVELAAIAPSESPLPQQAVLLSRSETPLIGQPSAVGIIAARSLLPTNNAASLVAGPTADPSTAVVRLPVKSPTNFRIAPLTEELVPPTKDTVTEGSNSPATINPSRVESQGPQPSPSVPVVAIASRTEVMLLRTPNRIDAATSTDAVARVALNDLLLSSRASRTPVIAFVTAESVSAPMPGGPAILLTSATMLVELLAPPQLSPLPRTESVGPTSSFSAESLGNLARWFSRAAKPATLDEATSVLAPRSSAAAPSLPRRERTLTPAELVEEP